MTVSTATPKADERLLEALVAAALAAGKVVMEVYEGGFAVEEKADHSPVTEADRRAEAVILDHLARLAPGVPVVAEEAVSEGRLPPVGRTFFLVDPVDGTREFVSRNGDFTVNIALIEDGVPVLGVVHAPAKGRLFAGAAGLGATVRDVSGTAVGPARRIAVAGIPSGAARIVASRSHRTAETDAFIARYPGAALVSAGSSLKFCLVAAGEADLYPRLGPTMQWDTAAGDAVLRAAGGMVSMLDGTPLHYGPAGGEGVRAYANPWFVATGGLGIAPL